jgi:hypothetical protein
MQVSCHRLRHNAIHFVTSRYRDEQLEQTPTQRKRPMTKVKEKMSDQNFTATITVDQTPEEAIEAIKNIRGWWSQQLEGSTDKLGDECTYRFEDVHSCKMKLVEVIPQKKVAWIVLDNYFKFTKDKTEWLGTKIVFDVSRKDNKTEIRFTHEGLVPEYECFNICSSAWGSYINGSLRSLIATGEGQPNPKE